MTADTLDLVTVDEIHSAFVLEETYTDQVAVETTPRRFPQAWLSMLTDAPPHSSFLRVAEATR